MPAIFPVNIAKNKDLLIYLTSIGKYYVEDHTIYRKEGFFDYQILLTVEGMGEFSSGKMKMTLEPGSLLFLPANIPHKYHPVTDVWKTNWLSYNGTNMDAFHKRIGLNNISSTTTTLLPEDSFNFKSHLEAIYNLTEKGYTQSSLHISTLIYELVYNLSQLREEQSNTSSPSLEGYIRQIIDYIDIHYMEDLTIEELALYLDISPQYLCRLFQSMLSVRPFEYIKQVRLNKSKNLLIHNTDMSISDVASAVGFHSTSYYGSLFKKLESKTPRQFRETFKRGV